MSVSPENIQSGGDPCLWCCFPCLFTIKICESMCKCFSLMCCKMCSKVCPEPDINDENMTKKQYINNIYQDKWQLQEDIIEETKINPKLVARF